MTRIAIISPNYPWDNDDYHGILAATLEIELESNGFETFVFAPKFGKLGHESNPHHIKLQFSPTNGAFINLNLRNPVTLLKSMTFLTANSVYVPWKIYRENIEGVICLWGVPSGIFGYFSSLFLRVPYIVWLLGSDVNKIAKYPAGPRILRGVLKRSRSYFADGKELLTLATEISGTYGSFLPSSRNLLLTWSEKDKTKFSPLSNSITYIGRLHPDKGPDLLIEAISILKNEYSQAWTLNLFGSGPMDMTLLELVDRYKLGDQVFFRGPIKPDKVGCKILEAEVVVIPSRSESMPMLYTEACQVGCRLIVTDVGDMGQVSKNFMSALVCEPTASDLASALSQTSEISWEQYTDGQSRLVQEYSISTSAKTIIDSLQQ